MERGEPHTWRLHSPRFLSVLRKERWQVRILGPIAATVQPGPSFFPARKETGPFVFRVNMAFSSLLLRIHGSQWKRPPKAHWWEPVYHGPKPQSLTRCRAGTSKVYTQSCRHQISYSIHPQPGKVCSFPGDTLHRLWRFLDFITQEMSRWHLQARAGDAAELSTMHRTAPPSKHLPNSVSQLYWSWETLF